MFSVLAPWPFLERPFQATNIPARPEREHNVQSLHISEVEVKSSEQANGIPAARRFQEWSSLHEVLWSSRRSTVERIVQVDLGHLRYHKATLTKLAAFIEFDGWHGRKSRACSEFFLEVSAGDDFSGQSSLLDIRRDLLRSMCANVLKRNGDCGDVAAPTERKRVRQSSHRSAERAVLGPDAPLRLGTDSDFALHARWR